MNGNEYRAIAWAHGATTRKDLLALTGLSDDLVLLVGAAHLFTWLRPADLVAEDFAWCVIECCTDISGRHYSRPLRPSSGSIFTSYRIERYPLLGKWAVPHMFGTSFVADGDENIEEINRQLRRSPRRAA